MTQGQKVVETALKYLGVVEKPNGSNRGQLIDQWQRRWGMVAQPWCGMFVDAMFAEAGVDDSNICHPSTAVMASRIRSGNFAWRGIGPVPPGSLWVLDGIHTALVIQDLNNGSLLCVDGNSSNMVRKTIHPRSGFGIVVGVPPAVRDEVPAQYKTFYYLEDLKADPYVYRLSNGRIPKWKVRSYAEATVENMLAANPPAWKKKNPRVVKSGNGRFVIQLGDVKTRKFTTKNKRDEYYNAVVKKYGTGRFRKYSKKFKVN